MLKTTGAEIAKLVESGASNEAMLSLGFVRCVPIFEQHSDEKGTQWCTSEYKHDGFVFIFIFKDWVMVGSEAYQQT